MQPPRVNIYFSYIVGILYGLLYAGGDFRHPGLMLDLQQSQVSEGLTLAILMPFVLRLFQQFAHDFIITPLARERECQAYYRYALCTYLIFFLPNEMLTGVKGSFALTLALLIGFALLQASLFLLLLDRDKRLALMASEKYIAVLFLISGFSALIYQVVWQRVLFTTFGINSEAVTVIVSVFMFGLGMGALAGGYLQKRYDAYLLPIFVGLEVSIGLFGIFSLDLIHFIGHNTHDSSTPELVGWTYLILALPTLFMGATLPILVAFLQKYFHNIGKTVGLLYAFNTIGSAIAAFCTVEILFVFMGQEATIWVAAVCNLATAGLIFDASRRLRAAPVTPVEIALPDQSRSLAGLPYPFVFSCLIAIGYISLSQEILWYRLLGFLTGGRPQVFGLLLTAFLIGIALGALKSKKICEGDQDPYAYVIRALALATLIFYLAVPGVAYVTGVFGKTAGPVVGYGLIAILAYYTGGMLPMLIHIGVGKGRIDSALSMSWLYFANIIGATCGPLLTGFILLEKFTLEGNVVILSMITLLLLASVILYVPKELWYKLKVCGLIGCSCLIAWTVHATLFDGHLEKLQNGKMENDPFKYKVENRTGIIAVEGGKENGESDVIFGGGIYDGRFNVDPVLNSNFIERAYMIAGLHRKPQKILEIGLSSGSWSKVLADYQPAQEIVSIEINKGYPEIIEKYPQVASILHDSKTKVYFDDGRRWLRNHPDEKFDLIVMNTTFHWRSNVTNLLSREFLQIGKQHLKENGVIYYNTTGSMDVIFTAAHVFKHVVKFINFVAASDAPFDMTVAEKRDNLLQFKQVDGTPLFMKNAQYIQKMNELAGYALTELHDTINMEKHLWLITDDNMAVEYKVH
jgi:spermidine synthase/MFS family permease